MMDDRTPSKKIVGIARRLRCCRRLHVVEVWARGCGSGKGVDFGMHFRIPGRGQMLSCSYKYNVSLDLLICGVVVF